MIVNRRIVCAVAVFALALASGVVSAATVNFAVSGGIARETQLAKKCADQRDYACALRHYRKALSELVRLKGERHKDAARYKNEIGIVYINMGQYAKASEVLLQAADIARQTIGNEDPDTLEIYSHLGLAFYRKGAYENALTWYQKTLEGQEKTEGVESSGVAETSTIIAFVYNAMGRYVDALSWYKKALAIREKTQGANLDTLALYDRIAIAHERIGERDEAKMWRQKSLTSREKPSAQSGYAPNQ